MFGPLEEKGNEIQHNGKIRFLLDCFFVLVIKLCILKAFNRFTFYNLFKFLSRYDFSKKKH